MTGSKDLDRLLITVTEANVRQSHLYLNGHLEFFPKEAIGPSSSRQGLGKEVQLDVSGFSRPIMTDLPIDSATGRPRGIFRKRSWVRQFYERNKIQPGDQILIERTDRCRYSVRPARFLSRIRAAEFFAGIGLVRLALSSNGVDVVFANDIDPDKQKMYVDNFGDTHFRLGDIHALNASDIPECDLFTASFPCNDLSIAGSMVGLNGTQSGAFWGLMHILRSKKSSGTLPRIVLLENVPGFLMSHEGRDFEAALRALNELGYVCDAVIVDAANFVPQSRARLFVIAKLGVESVFPLGLCESSARPKQLVRFVRNHPELYWNLLDLPRLPTTSLKLKDIVEDLPANHPAWWNEDRVCYFMGQLSERHMNAAAAMMKAKDYSYATAFRRVRYGRSMAELRTDGIAGCLRTPRGGSGRQILFKAGRDKRWVRLLTPRECARLQGVPDDYVIDASINQALFGFGDAVCIPVVEWVCTACILPVFERGAITEG